MEEIARFVEIMKNAGLSPELIADVLKETVGLSVEFRNPVQRS